MYLAKVDADQHKDLAGKYDVSGYPTIKIFKNGKIDSDYDGPREAKGIVKFVKSAVGITGGAGSVQRISTKAELDEMAKATATLVGLFKEPVSASAMFKAFAEVASELPSMVDEKNPVKVVYSASYKEVPLAADLGVKSPPAILLLAGKGSGRAIRATARSHRGLAHRLDHRRARQKVKRHKKRAWQFR